MRFVSAVVFSTALVATACAAAAAVTDLTDQPPLAMELNAPLLLQPVQDLPGQQKAASPQQEKQPQESRKDEPEQPDADAAKAEAKDTSTDKKAADAEKNTNAEKKVAEDETKAADSAAAESQPQAKPAEESKLPELSNEMKSLRAALRQTLASYYSQPLNTRDNTPANVLAACMAYGCDTQVRRDSPGGQTINAYTCLCSNYPCAGRGLLRVADGRLLAEVGYGLQEYPGQFLAAMALSRVPADYRLHIGDEVRTVSDLAEAEQKNCRSGEETSFRLIGLARYVPADVEWQNEVGETWSISRLIKEELDRPNDAAPEGGSFRLLALSYAVDRRMKRNEPIDGQYERAQAFLAKFTKYAMELQNPDGSWHPQFFAYRGQGGNIVDQIRSTGQIFRWLAMSLPDDQLRDARVVRTVSFLTRALESRRYQAYVYATSNREIAARYAAIHALVIYDDRLFVPYDEAEKAKQKQQDESLKKSVAAKPAERS